MSVQGCAQLESELIGQVAILRISNAELAAVSKPLFICPTVLHDARACLARLIHTPNDKILDRTVLQVS